MQREVIIKRLDTAGRWTRANVMRRSESVVALLTLRAVSSSSIDSEIAFFLLLLIFCPSSPRINGALLSSAVGSGKYGSSGLYRSLKRRAISRASSKCGSWSLPTGTTLAPQNRMSAA